MSNEEAEGVVKEKLKDSTLFSVRSINRIHHKPHPFTIGPEHIQRYHIDLKQGCAGYVNDQGEYRNSSKPGFHKCKLPYEAHTYETALFLSLKRNGTNAEANDEIKELAKCFEELKIDGIVFVETEEKYRIT